MCSIVPEMPDQKPFRMLVSIYSFLQRCLYILFLIQDVNTLQITGSKAIGRKFPGSVLNPFLWIRTVKPFFHTVGTFPIFQDFSVIFQIIVLTIGQRFRTMTLI